MSDHFRAARAAAGTRICVECGADLPAGTLEHCGKPTDEVMACPRPDCEDGASGTFWRMDARCLAYAVDTLAAERAAHEATKRELAEAQGLLRDFLDREPRVVMIGRDSSVCDYYTDFVPESGVFRTCINTGRIDDGDACLPCRVTAHLND